MTLETIVKQFGLDKNEEGKRLAMCIEVFGNFRFSEGERGAYRDVYEQVNKLSELVEKLSTT